MRSLAPREPEDDYDEEIFMHLERDQFVDVTSRPVDRAPLSERARAALWALRVFAIALSGLVVYTFVARLA